MDFYCEYWQHSLISLNLIQITKNVISERISCVGLAMVEISVHLYLTHLGFLGCSYTKPHIYLFLSVI